MMNPTIDPATGQPLILGRTAKFWSIFAVVITVLFIIAVTFFTNALVYITYTFGDQARKGDVKVQLLNSRGELKDLSLLGNLALIPRDAKAIIAKTDNSQTVQHINNLPFFGVPNYNLTLQAQNELSKVGAETLGCNLENEFGLFTYNCTTISNINQISRPENGPWEILPVETGRTEIIFSRYKNGFLALDEKTVEYLIPGKAVQLYALPTDFSIDSDNIELITDPDSTNHAFIVANYTQGKFLWVEDFTATARQTAFQRRIDTNPQFNISLCSMNQVQLSCYYGPDSHDHDNTDENTRYRTEHPHGKLEVIQLQNTSESKFYTFEDLPNADQLYQTKDGLYVTSEKQLYQMSLDNDRAQASLLATKVATAASAGATLFYTTDDDQLFEYNGQTETATMRFHSGNLTSLDLSTYGGNVLINAFINADSTSDVGNVAHVYRLTNKTLPESAIRKEDKLPYKDDSLPISYLDYSDSTIYVSPEQTFTTDAQGIRAIDITALNNSRSRIVQKLTDDGFLTGTVKVLFAD